MPTNQEIGGKLDDLEKRVRAVETAHAEHVATCEERGKRIEGKLDDIHEQTKSDTPPKTWVEAAWRFVGRHGLGAAAMILLGVVIYFWHSERTKTQVEAKESLRELKTEIHNAVNGKKAAETP